MLLIRISPDVRSGNEAANSAQPLEAELQSWLPIPPGPTCGAPIRAQRFAAPRIPPVASNGKCVTTGSALGNAGSRRCSVMRGAFTFFPGLSRPRGSKSCLSEHIAPYSSRQRSGVELTAHETVAVLAAVVAAEFRDERADLLGDGSQRRRPHRASSDP